MVESFFAFSMDSREVAFREKSVYLSAFFTLFYQDFSGGREPAKCIGKF